MRALLLALALLLSGCSAMGSRGASVGCQVADAATTVAAIHGGAVEANPLMAGVIQAVGLPGFVLLKLGLAWALVAKHDDIPQGARAGANAVACAAALSNVGVIAR